MVLLLIGLSAASAAESLPNQLSLEQVERVDFSRADTAYLSFPDVENDREKILSLLNMYNQAFKTIGPEGPVDFGADIPFFMNEVSICLKDGQSFSIYLYDQGIYYITGYQEDGLHGFQVTNQALGKKFYDLAMSLFVPAREVTLDCREFKLGDQVTVSSDHARGEALIFLMPTYSPCTIPSAPDPYPIPEAILLDRVPVEHDCFSHTFTLKEEMGKKMDGSPGQIRPGEWQLVVSSGGGSTFLPVFILPPEIPTPRAVAYDGGRVLVWQEGKIQFNAQIHPNDQPLLINNSKFNSSPITYISLSFLGQYLGVPVENAGGKFILGGPELGLTVEPDRKYARMNGTMPYLSGIMGKNGGVWRLPWEELARFFSYQVKWLGPEKVVFLRNQKSIPDEMLSELNKPQFNSDIVQGVKISLAGENTIYSSGKPYFDRSAGKVMVPLRDTIAALGGKLVWYPIDYDNNDPLHSRRLGAGVISYMEVTLGNHVWGLYQGTEKNGSTTMVQLRQLALALGYQLTWDSQNMQANLVAGK